MKKLLISLLAIVLLTSLAVPMHANADLEKEKKILLEKDREISKASAAKGILPAFYPFMTAHTVLFPLNGHPVYGKEACAKLIKHIEMKGTGGMLQWEPLFADVSMAGDLGYTHGRFEQTVTDAKGNKKTGTGYYGTIWQKDSAGDWKVVVSQGLILLKDLNQKPIPEDKKRDLEKTREVVKEVVATERAFSDYSVKHGMVEAFFHFIADNGIALSGVGAPKRKENYARFLAAAKEKKETAAGKSTLKWEPIYSHAAASGDMAYNYGTYKYTGSDAKGNIQEIYGYFVTVWKRQADNTWRFVFDGGNQSPPPGKENR